MDFDLSCLVKETGIYATHDLGMLAVLVRMNLHPAWTSLRMVPVVRADLDTTISFKNDLKAVFMMSHVAAMR